MSQKIKTAGRIITRILSVCLTILAVSVMLLTVYSVFFVGKNDRSVFGVRAYTVLTDSMKATDFAAGDIIFCKKTDVLSLREGDIITFENADLNDNDRFGQVITHKIAEVSSAGGLPVFVTYGTSNRTADGTYLRDSWPVPASAVLGKYMFRIPGLGNVFTYMKTPLGYVLCILIPFAILILFRSLESIRLFRRYKKEQSEALEAEREQLQKEREESQRMLEELRALKEQLAGQKQDASDTAPPDSPAEVKKAENSLPEKNRKPKNKNIRRKS